MNFKGFKKIDSLKRLYIISVFFIVVYIALFYIFLIPSIDSIKEIRNEVLSEKIQLENKLNREKNMTKLNDDLKQVEGKVDLLDEIFINKNKELEFITVLEGKASQNKVEQNLNLNIDKTVKKNIYSSIPLDIIVNGTYTNVLSYLQSIENLKYYLNNHGLSINLKRDNKNLDNSQQSQSATMQINSETFWK